jgi:hypothetical protein
MCINQFTIAAALIKAIINSSVVEFKLEILIKYSTTVKTNRAIKTFIPV